MASFTGNIYVANDIKIRKGTNKVITKTGTTAGNASEGGTGLRISADDKVIFYNTYPDIYRFIPDSNQFYNGQKITIIGPYAIHIKPRPNNYTQVDGSISQHSKATTGKSIELMYYDGQWYTKEYTE